MRRIVLIDGDVLVYKVAFAVEQAFDWGEGQHTLYADEQQAKQAMDELIKEILTNLKTTERHVALTCHDTVNFRKEFYPQYKENRTEKRKPLVWKAMRAYLTEEYAAQTKPNLEADDIIGIWATKLWPGKPELVVASIDKDFKSVPCRLYNLKSKETEEFTEEQADFNFMCQVLTGDKTDNYPGCPGIGPKKAERILLNAVNSKTPLWQAVLNTYQHAGFGAEYALTQARCARILRSEDYDFKEKKPILWVPRKEGL